MLKNLTSHLKPWIKFIQDFFTVATFIKNPCMFNRPDIKVERLKVVCEFFKQHISIRRLHIWHFLYFIPYIVTAKCIICVISWLLMANLSSCINLVISKHKLKPQYAKLTKLWYLTVKWVFKVGFKSYLRGLS